MGKGKILLGTLKFDNLRKIAKKEGIKGTSRKSAMINRLVENLTREQIRDYYKEFIGKTVDISKSDMVPKFRLMKEAEVKKFLKKYNISKKQVPKILITDPAVIELGADLGEVIEFTRNSPTTDKSKYYRVVIGG